MTTIISLDGGFGRIITAIPALLKYHKNHPGEEWYIMIPGWDFITWGFPELQERTFNPDARGSFDLFWKADKVITPEPYRVPAYYRNEISLRESFDICINDSTNHSDLPPMQLRLSSPERRKAYEIIEKAKKLHKKKKTILLQPFGSTATPHPSAGTHRVNVTYDGFHIIERDVPFYPDSMRISGFQAHMSSRLNEPRIQFTSEEIENAYQEIILSIEGEVKKEKSQYIVKPIGISYK
jgi:hypothetical protein